jgi:hypothetical protein
MIIRLFNEYLKINDFVKVALNKEKQIVYFKVA